MCVLGGGDRHMCVGVVGQVRTCVCVCMSANQSMQLVHVPLSSWHNAVLDNLTKCATIV